VTVLVTDDQDEPIPIEPLSGLARIAMEAEGLETETVVSLSFVDVAAMTLLNEAHMDKQGPTDVLSFPIEDAVPGSPPQRDPDGPPLHLGDIFVCPEVVGTNAKTAGVSVDDELSLMVVHGVLHLLGYDHVDDADAELMEGRERSILQSVGRVRA
jgi:probable rRNA maturation factor